MVCIMVGKKFFMAFAEEFLELCRVLSCQSVQSSPLHSASSQTNQQKNKNIVNTISEIVVNEEMGSSPSKINDLESPPDQDQVLSILSKEKGPIKKSKFSPYTPLPAIGKTNLDKATTPIKRIVRQETYRVSNPVYIKGPFDVYKFPSLKDRLAVEESGLRKTSRTFRDNQIQGEDRNKHSDVSNSKNKATDSLKLPKSEFEKFKLKTKNGFIKNRQSQTNQTCDDNSNVFWIDF